MSIICITQYKSTTNCTTLAHFGDHTSVAIRHFNAQLRRRGESGGDANGKDIEEKRYNMERGREMQRFKCAEIGVDCYNSTEIH